MMQRLALHILGTFYALHFLTNQLKALFFGDTGINDIGEVKKQVLPTVRT